MDFSYRLRPAKIADGDELFRIHRESMGDYLRRAFADWSDTVDREHHDRWMSEGRAQVVVIDDRIVGSLDVVRDGDAI